jgi:hypothetical protein
MKQLHPLYLWLLPMAAHFAYFSTVSESLSKAGAAVQAALAPLTPELALWLAKEEALMQWMRKSALTEKIAGADRQIDRALVSINAVVEAARYAQDPGIKNAANSVYIMLRNYGRVSRKPYDEQAGDLRLLLAQFGDQYSAAATLIGLTPEVARLQAAFDLFETLFHQRGAERVRKPAYTFRDVRKGIERVYHLMTPRINAGSLLDVSPDFGAFIDRLNPDIDRLNAEFKRHRHRIQHRHAAEAAANDNG